MWKGAFQGLYLVHGLILAGAAIGFFRFWRRTRFWLPKYVHVLAAGGLAMGIWTVSLLPANAPINKYGLVGRLVLVLAVPAMVYFVFVFHGGQRAAFRRTVSKLVPCPSCGKPIAAQPSNLGQANSSLRFVDRECQHCGMTLVGLAR
jgi:peptidoglycan/LPS O-acetylase OafA/YrhL